MERLGIRTQSLADGSSPGIKIVQRDTLLVEQECVLTGRRGEGTLGQAQHDDRLEAEVPQRVDVDHGDAFAANGSVRDAVELGAVELLQRTHDRADEA